MSDLITQYLLQGDLVGFIFAVFTSSMGEYFYGIIVLVLTVPLYIRTQSLTYVYLLWALLGGILTALLPLGVLSVANIFLALGIGGLLYKLYVSR